MGTIDLKTIKKIWKRKLTNDFNEKKEFFNVYVDSPFCFYPGCGYCCYRPCIIKGKEGLKVKDEYYNKVLISNIRDFKDILGIRTPDTVYFGGGSSSIMTVKQMKAIFRELQKYFDFKNKVKEKTFELNPSQITEEKIKLLGDWNFTHMSIGVQTFNKKVLKFNHRINPTIKRFKEIFKLFENVTYQYNMDLMAFIYKGDVDEDIKILKKDLQIATNILKPTRITIFPNYFQLLDIMRGPQKKRNAILRKVKALRSCIKGFDKGGYKALHLKINEINYFNYRCNYYLIKKERFKDITYNCSAWYSERTRLNIINQNTLALGGYGKRTPYSYISDRFCYDTINIPNKRLFRLMSPDASLNNL